MRKFINRKKIDQLLPSEAEMIKKFKASRNTLRSALALLKDEGLIDSKAGIGTRIISLVPKKIKKKIIQVILPTTGYQFFYEIMDGINAILGPLDIVLQYKNCNNNLKVEQQYLQDAITEEFDGLIYMSYFNSNKICFPPELNKNKKVVMVNNKVKGFEGTLITSDNEEGAHMMVAHMIKKGHQNIIHLGGAECSSHQDRKKGYIKAMSEKNLEIHVFPVGSSIEDGYNFITKVLNKKQIAGSSFFCANDFSALGCCKGLKKLGFELPEDVLVTGFGGLNDQISSSTFSLTTMKQDAYELGKKAAEQLIDDIHGEKKCSAFKEINLPVSLVKQSSKVFL